MTKPHRLVLAISIAAVTATLQPASAVCHSARLFTTGDSYIYTPGCGSNACGTGDTSMTDAAVGLFWAIGSGDPAIGPGNDNGSFPFLNGWAHSTAGYPTYVNSTWAADPGIDFCIDASLDRCMAILIMDNDADTGAGAFALLTKEPSSLGNYDFEQEGPINLAFVPRPSITYAIDIVNNMVMEVAVTGVSSSDIDAGLYLDANCPQAAGSNAYDVILGYQVFMREVALADPPPAGNNIDDGWIAVGPIVPLGEPSQFNLTCPGDPAVAKYLATGLWFDSGFQTVLLSGLSTRIECGANLAEPEDEIQRKPRNRERPRSRGR